MVIQQVILYSYNCDEVIYLVNEIFTETVFRFYNCEQHEKIYHMLESCLLALFFLYFDLCNNLFHDCSVHITIQKLLGKRIRTILSS